MKATTISHRVACLKKWVVKGLSTAEWAEVAGLLVSTRRTLVDDRDNKGKDALLAADLTKLLAVVPRPPDAAAVDVRNRALLLLLWYSAMRRSEVSALQWRDVDWTNPAGIILRIRRSKTDQEGAGQLVDIARKPAQLDRCTVTALQEWKTLLAPLSAEQPVFPHVLRGSAILRDEPIGGQRVLKLVKQLCTAAGLDSAKFGAHSFRSGFITAGAQAGIQQHQLQKHARHKSAQTTAGYCKRAELLGSDTPTARI